MIKKFMEMVVSTAAWGCGYLTGFFRGWECALGRGVPYDDDDTDPEIYMDHCHGE